MTISFPAFRSRNYRLYFGGQSISLIGTWMTRVATSWLVYRLTDSAFLLGVVGFLGQIPALFLSPLAGVWVDRWDRHQAMVITQALAMVQSLALAVLTLTHTISMPWIFFLTFLQGVINTFETPARQSFVIQMIDDRSALSNAIALNSSIVNAGRLVGPAIAGIVIAWVGEGYCFLIDGVSYIAVLYSLLAMKNLLPGLRNPPRNVGQELSEGWRYIISSPAIRWILLMLGLVSLIGMPFTVLMPIIADKVLGGGAHTLGFLTAATGLGALACAVALAMRRSVVGLGKWLGIAAAILGVSLILFGLSRSFWWSMVLMFGAGYGMMQQIVTSNTILQTIVADDKRGRVMSFYSMSVFGFLPIGSLFAGMLASWMGAPNTLILGGALCLLASVWYFGRLPEIRRVIRPVYIEMGIMDDPAAAIEAEGR
ncbi:MAG TPA: MFS transporter [Bryobacteraceae bacterium]|nr:MFS transporter [Bryobacteraceae bacterium]